MGDPETTAREEGNGGVEEEEVLVVGGLGVGWSLLLPGYIKENQ